MKKKKKRRRGEGEARALVVPMPLPSAYQFHGAFRLSSGRSLRQCGHKLLVGKVPALHQTCLHSVRGGTRSSGGLIVNPFYVLRASFLALLGL